MRATVGRLTRDQDKILRALALEDTYEGALPLFTGLSEQRCREVLRQLQRRNLVERKIPRQATWHITILGRQTWMAS